MSRKALIIGIDYYEGNSLYGCVNDASKVAEILSTHADGTINFDVKLMTSTSNMSKISAHDIEKYLDELFGTKGDVVLFYFAGHGYTKNGEGYIVDSESDFSKGQYGFSMSHIIKKVADSPAHNKILVFDCCHAGEIANNIFAGNISQIPEGTTILAACTKDQYASEVDGKGTFTSLFVDALHGSAASIVGKISPGSVYAHIDQSLGNWEQRPVFKSNIERFISLRDMNPRIPIVELKKITEIFIDIGDEFQLNPTFEPEHDDFIPANGEIFKILQNMVKVDLVRPVDEEHMYYAAINSKSCRLTSLGQHFWSLVKKNRI